MRSVFISLRSKEMKEGSLPKAAPPRAAPPRAAQRRRKQSLESLSQKEAESSDVLVKSASNSSICA